MFFKDYFIAVANCLDAQLEGYKQQAHSGDKGEKLLRIMFNLVQNNTVFDASKLKFEMS